MIVPNRIIRPLACFSMLKWLPTALTTAKLTAVILTLVTTAYQQCHAQWSQSDRDRIADLLASAALQIDTEAFPSPDQATQNFLAAIESTDDFLRSNTTDTNYQNWMKFLQADELVDALQRSDAFADNQTARLIGREAIALRFRLVGTAPGLELPVLTRLRDSTETLIDAARFRDADRSAEQVAGQLQKFADQVRSMNADPSAEEVASITQMMGLLRSTGQSPELISKLRSRFASPNIKILLSEQIVQSAINRCIDQSRPVRDCILGTRIVGTAKLGGTITANVLPSFGSAAIDVQLAGTVRSRSIGYNGPVKLHTVSRGQVNVTRTLHVDEAGIRAQPTVATASLNSEIVSIDHKLRLVRRIARKRAAEQKPKADRIGTERLRTQVAQQFTDQTDQARAVDLPNPLAKLNPILTRLNLQEPLRTWGSTDTDIYIDATLAGNDQLSAPGPTFVSTKQPFVGGHFDFAVQLHETAIDNLVAPIIAGRTITETQLDELLSRSGIKSTPPDSNDAASNLDRDEDNSNGQDTNDQGADEPPFEIDFARLRPIVFEAREQSIKLGIRGTRFSQGRRELKQSLEITANYLPATLADGTSVLIRDGDVAVDFPSRGRKLSVSQTGLKTTIEKKFADVFPETLLHRPLQVPADAAIDAIAGQTFRSQSVDARDGWLTIKVARTP